MKKKRNRFHLLDPLVKKAINQFGSGIHRSLLKDVVGEIDTVRDYVPGDKRLDSAASLKAGRVMSRACSTEKSMNIFILLDVSKSQFYGSNRLKIEVGIAAGAYLTHLAGNVGDKVGLLTFDQSITNFIELTVNEKEVANILYLLEEPRQYGTDWRSAFERVINLNLNNSLIVLISDFCFEVGNDFVNALRKLSVGSNNCLLALALIDDNEWQLEDLPFEARFLDAESNRSSALIKASKNKIYFGEDLENNLRHGHCEPLFVDINSDRFLMPLIKYFLRNIV